MTKILATLLIWAIALTPTWFWIAMKFLLNPVGFWQNFLFLGAGLFFLGVIQLILLVLGTMATFAIYDVIT